MANEMTNEHKLKLVMLGEMGVGKSALLTRFMKQTYRETSVSTIIDCYHRKLEIMKIRVLLELWDTAGQERYRSIVRNYYRDADGVVLVYDVTDICTFHKLSSWLLELKNSNDTAITVIVGNKIDVAGTKAVSVTCVKRFVENENLEFFEASAKTGENVNEIFENLTLKILEAKELVSRPSTDQTKTISSGPPETIGSGDTSVAETAFVSHTPSGKSICETNTETYNSIKLHLPTITPPVKKKKCC